MSAAVTAAAVSAATATVEAATAAHCATAANCTTASNCTTVEPTADRYMRTSTVEAVANSAASDVATMPAITAVPAIAAVPAVAPAITGASIEAPAVPRAGTDEQTTREVARTVVTVRRASVWVISVVTVRANRSRADVARTDAHSDRDVLRMHVRR
jgi:hypothetical protein